MNFLSENILQAAEIIVEKKLEELKYDITVEATIEAIVNLDIGEYKVKYNSNIFSAFANDLNYKYSIGDNIYLKIPEGDFSQKKFIENKVSNKSISEIDLTNLQNSISPIEPSLDKFYNYEISNDNYGVIAGAPADKLGAYTIYSANGSVSHDGFLQYANKYDTLEISAEFQTLLQNNHIKGNYGLEITFFTKSLDGAESEVSYRLDFNSFNGNPYRFNNFSKQSAIVKIQKQYLTGLKSIVLFQEDFNYDKIMINGEPGQENKENKNIFVKNILLQFVEQKNLLDSLYYLKINTPNGLLFTRNNLNDDEIRLEGLLIYNGESILTSNNSKCYWYEKDLSVMLGKTEIIENQEIAIYDKVAGPRWRKIQDSGNILIVKKQDVPYKKDYKLVVVYNENIVIAEEVSVANNTNDYNFEIYKENNFLGIKYNEFSNSNDCIVKWYVSLPDSSYREVGSGTLDTTIDISNYLKYSFATFYCAIIYNDSLLSNEEYFISNLESKEDVIVTFVGEDLFRYDANGDIAYEDSERERTIQYEIAFKEGVSANYSVQWIAPDGKELNGNDYSPADSMIANMWVDNYNICHFTVRQKYYVNYNNNVIKIKITTLDQQEYIFEKEILFLKDGDQGTNGTTYVMAIRPCDNEGNKLSGFQGLIYNNQIWENSLRLKAYIYKDGELLNRSDLNIEWFLKNVIDISGDIPRAEIMISGIGELETEYYVRAHATIDDIQLYALYPINILVNGSISDFNLIDINDIPSYIKYTSSGVNPSYNQKLKFSYNNEDKTDSIKSLNDNLQVRDKLDGTKYLSPKNNFIFENLENTIGSLQCSITTDKYIIHPIIMYLDTYGNEAINGWDGTKLAIDEENGQYIFAPQVGAGVKDAQNRFTGVVMGKDSGQNKIGLYGYQDGINTFGLMENGQAYFGASGNGRIQIDGTSAMIYGGMGRGAANSMTLTLNSQNLDRNTKAIEIRDSNNRSAFSVDYKGFLIANNANITGIINADELYTSYGSIGGWEITDRVLYSTSRKTFLNSDGSIQIGGDLTAGQINIWYVSNNGSLQTNYGYMGRVTGSELSGGTSTSTTTLGLKSINGHSVIVESDKHISINATNGGIWLRADRIVFMADEMSGVMAQFL